MINNIFKSLFLVVAILFVLVLYGIYTKLDSGVGRYQAGASSSIVDTKTGITYYLNNEKYEMIDRSGKQTEVDSIK
jgi:hypothetical protein